MAHWLMENECVFWGLGEGSVFVYADIDKNRKLEFPWYPYRNEYKVTDNRCKIPEKKPDEIRICSCDIALMASTTRKNNDASSIFINSVQKQKNGRFLNNIVYTENNEGLRTDIQALNIRRLFENFQCDYLVLDFKGAGLSVGDLLMADITDPDTGTVYGGLSCCNSEEIAKRCFLPRAPKKIWAIQGSAELNTQCTLKLKEAFEAGDINLLLSKLDSEEAVFRMRGSHALTPEERENLKLPFISTELLVTELINLNYEVRGNAIKIKEKSGMRKDRYSSLSYNIYVSKELERTLPQNNNDSGNLKSFYRFIPPKIQTRR
jgi:hypothetical protein